MDSKNDPRSDLLVEIDAFLADKGGDAKELLAQARAQIASLEAEIGERVQENEELEEKIEEHDTDVAEAVHRFLDVVERPCGTRTFIIPESGERDRALIGLHDAIGRRL